MCKQHILPLQNQELLKYDPFISCNDRIEKKCCITNAYLQWLYHSGEQAVAYGAVGLLLKSTQYACGKICTCLY